MYNRPRCSINKFPILGTRAAPSPIPSSFGPPPPQLPLSNSNDKGGKSNKNAADANKRRMTAIQIQVGNIHKKTIERHNLSFHYKEKGGYNKFAQLAAMPTDELIGAVCLNNGCNVVMCTDLAVMDTECQHHRGILVSNQQMDTNSKLEIHQQFWSCCIRKPTNLLGCVVGKHRWIKREREDSVRHDWFYRAGLIHISIYCRSAVPQGTRVESDGLKLNVTVAHAFGTKETAKHFELFAEIVPAESMMLISDKKVEIILKQVKREPWTRLTYEIGDGALCDGDDEDGAAFLVEDDDDGDDGNCYAVY